MRLAAVTPVGGGSSPLNKAKRSISPLTKGEIVKAVEMAPEDECKQEMFISIIWGKRTLAVPLSQIEGVEVNDEIQ